MQTLSKSIFIILLTVITTACQTTLDSDHADLLYKNGTIYTVDPENKFAEAMAIKDGKIISIGKQTQVETVAGANTRVIDLQGGMIMPGLIDGHLHPVRGAIKELYNCNFSYSATPLKIQQTISDCVKNQTASDWILGGQWDSGFFNRHNIESPRAFLDEVSGDKAIILQDDSLHNVWVNSRALELAGFDKNTPNPEAGTIVRNKNGQPNGILLETAAKAISQIRPPYSALQQETAVIKFVHDANAFGLTGAKSASSYPYELAAMQAIDAKNGLTLHMAASMRSVDGKRSSPLNYAELESARTKYASKHLDTNFVKIFLDGVPTPARTAGMLAPYLPNDAFPESFDGGDLLVDPQTLAADLIALDKRGFTVKIHAAGDRSVRVALDAIEAARKANGASGLRHELAHAGYIEQTDLPRFKQLNAVADLSPILWYPSPIIDAIYSAVGKARGRFYFPVRDLIDSGANLLAGSDWPAVSVNANPWVGIESLVTRQHPHEKNHDVLWPEQAISLEEAIHIYSLDGARALRKEHLTGSLEVGKSADFIILKTNIFDLPIHKVSEILPEQTWFEGKLVFSRH